MKNAQWKYLLSYVVFLCFEITIIYFLWPETSGRTLEELAFLFEDKDKAEQAAAATDKQLQHDDGAGEDYRTGVSEKEGPTVVQSEGTPVAEKDGAPIAEKDGAGVTTIENKTT